MGRVAPKTEQATGQVEMVIKGKVVIKKRDNGGEPQKR